MSEPNLYERQRTALRELIALIEERTRAEATASEAYRVGRDAADREIHRQRKAIAASREKEHLHVETAFADEIRDLTTRFEATRERLQAEWDESRRLIAVDADNARFEAKTKHQDALWTLDSLREANEKRALDHLETAQRKLAAGRERMADMWAEVEPCLDRVGIARAEVEPSEDQDIVPSETVQDLEGVLTQAESLRRRLIAQRGQGWVGGRGFIVFALLGAVLGALPGLNGLRSDDPSALTAIGIGVIMGMLLSGGIWGIIRNQVLRRMRDAGQAFALTIAQGYDLAEHIEGRKQARYREIMSEISDKHAAEKIRADGTFRPIIAQLDQRRAAAVLSNDATYRKLIADHQNAFDQNTTDAQSRHQQGLKDCENGHNQRLADAETTYQNRINELASNREHATQSLTTRWNDGIGRFHGVFGILQQAGVEQFPEWDAVDWSTRAMVTQVPEGIRFGRMTVAGEYLSASPSQSESMIVPAYLPFPDRGVLTLKYKEHGRAEAVQSLQAVMLRFLTAVPPGKVRFTVVDPVGLGDNFAAFMHLADYDEQLITSRIWTEPSQIEQRLEDLTAHMETVIQKYLRNQYRTIEEYNRQAGEVAEPFRVLVVANFPTNFTPESAKRLLSIAASGATCGVYTLISIDARLSMPQGFHLSDLERLGLNFVWKDGQFTWKEPELNRFPIVLDTPPSTELVTKLVQKVGAESRAASRVEVPFDHVAPPPDQVWTSDSRKGIRVPLGRAGATRYQSLALGQGTSQHALIAGKTGSGKSTLLHALITNAALYYSPDELEMYLIDFKKGVEFKAYAAHELPHARVVAIESEREFGLSVLQRLDAELRARGDRYRACGANDVNSYRAATGEKLPRILLIVDEFQEFFVADDKLSQEAALLLDRLVRQGRAFGLHVLLGSQTLGGAYSLARSTIDQMAVRIALQCSDADAQLILHKDNAAARLLSRPGEAIYNDSSGSLEGNDLFQVVWLSDERREEALTLIRDKAIAAGFTRTPLVFEGNALAELNKNPHVEQLLSRDTWPELVKSSTAWLGEAIAIKDPTAAVFRPQTGLNLLMVGQNEEAALAMLASALVGLGLQHAPQSAQFVVLDGTPPDDVNAGLLASIAEILPHRVRMPDRAELPTVLGEWAEEVKSRLAGTPSTGPRFLIVHGLQRFRDLRKGDDDFGFGRRGTDKVASPAELFTTLFRDGPSVGVHVLAWCDSLANVQRSLDRQALREFGLRVLFQMSATDSSNLIDNPNASRLGRNRAFFFHDELEQPEKFRPYGLPSRLWLQQVRQQLSQRGEKVHDFAT